jgi:hypothetical protein
MSSFRKRVKQALPTWLIAVLREANEKRNYHSTMRSPDRAVLRDHILPAFAENGGEILWVGCRRYTKEYPALLEARDATCWTIDIDPRVSRFGHPKRHITGSLLDAERLLPRKEWDAILCNGVFGFGIDEPSQQCHALAVMANLLAPGGWLMLGWNTDRVHDMHALAARVGTLWPAPYGEFPQRMAVEGVTHVYDFFQKA